VRGLFEALERDASPGELADERGKQIRALIVELADLEKRELPELARWASPNEPNRQRPARKGNWGPETRAARDAEDG